LFNFTENSNSKFLFIIITQKNALTDERVKFNPLQEPPTLREDIVGDYKDYFRFEFVDVTIKRIVKDNNVFDKEIHLEDNNDDELLNGKVLFQGFLADISPHLNYGRLYPIIDDEGKIDYQSFGIKDKNNLTIFSSIPSCINNASEWIALQSYVHLNLHSPLLHNTKDVRFRMSGNFTTTLTNIKFPREESIKSPSLSKLSEAKKLSLFSCSSAFLRYSKHDHSIHILVLDAIYCCIPLRVKPFIIASL
jgi:hypothetical protein